MRGRKLSPRSGTMPSIATIHPAPLVYKEDWEIDSRLVPFDVTRPELVEIARAVVGARADAVDKRSALCGRTIRLYFWNPIDPCALAQKEVAAAPVREHRVGPTSKTRLAGHLSKR